VSSLDTTITRTLDEATRASLAAAAEAAARGDIQQRQVAPGIWVLIPTKETT
jgi:hypothetical protein